MINMWALSQIIEDRLHPQTQHESALNKHSGQKHIQISVIVAALALAILSRIPRVYSAYEDGEDLFFLSLSNLPDPWYSLILSMYALVLNHTLPKMYRPLQASKKNCSPSSLPIKSLCKMSLKHLLTKRNLKFAPASSCYPQGLACAKAISIVPNALAYSAIQHTCEANFSPTPSLAIQSVPIPAFFCIASSVSFEVVEAIANYTIKKYGSEHAKRLIQTDNHLKNLSRSVHKTAFRNFAHFLNTLDEDVREILCDGAVLKRYLKSKTVPHLNSDAFA